MDNKFLSNVDRYTQRFGLLNSLVGAVVDKFIPNATAVACGGFLECETGCNPCTGTYARPWRITTDSMFGCSNGPTYFCYTGPCQPNCAY